MALFGRSWSGVGEEKRHSGPILSYKYDTNPLLLVLFVSSLVAFLWRPHFPGAVFSKIEKNEEWWNLGKEFIVGKMD